MCRPNDVRRGGFLESHGGGTFLVTRGDIARDLGLPVKAVVGWVGSFSDGIHASVPAPGIGAVAAAQGGKASPMGRALKRLGLTADDIRVAYKHDTSTRANDPNENQLHQTIQRALGADAGAPLFVVSQKSITGHSKGGAAAFQIGGAIAAMATGSIAGNFNLETVDPSATPHEDLVFSDRLTELGPAEPVKASLVTSLGFGHVGALALLAHPSVFEAALGEDERGAWRGAGARMREARHREAVLAGAVPLRAARTRVCRSRVARTVDMLPTRAGARPGRGTRPEGRMTSSVSASMSSTWRASPPSSTAARRYCRADVHAGERAYASAKTPKARLSLAGRFAAKEAFIKAWSASRRGQSPALERVDLREIEVVVDPHGRPSLMLHGVVEDAFTRGAPCAIHLSISHDGPVAAATVLIDQPA